MISKKKDSLMVGAGFVNVCAVIQQFLAKPARTDIFFSRNHLSHQSRKRRGISNDLSPPIVLLKLILCWPKLINVVRGVPVATGVLCPVVAIFVLNSAR